MLAHIKKRHKNYFATGKINEGQILRFIDHLKKKVKSTNLPDSTAIGSKTPLTGNFLSKTNVVESSSSRPGSALSSSKNGVSEPQKPTLFAKSTPAPPPKKNPSPLRQNNISAADYNDYLNEDFDEDFEEEILDDEEEEISPPKKPENQKNAPVNGKNGKNTQLFAYGSKGKEEKNEDQEDIYGKIDFNQMNLNKMTDEEVKAAKEKMDIDFNKKIIKPTDKNFVYDKREEFDPQSSNDWDEEVLDNW
jgi:CEP19-like protein